MEGFMHFLLQETQGLADFGGISFLWRTFIFTIVSQKPAVSKISAFDWECILFSSNAIFQTLQRKNLNQI